VLHISRILLSRALCSARVPRNNAIDSNSEGYIAKDNIARAKLHNRVYISSAGDPPAAGRERLHVARLARAVRASLARRRVIRNRAAMRLPMARNCRPRTPVVPLPHFARIPAALVDNIRNGIYRYVAAPTKHIARRAVPLRRARARDAIGRNPITAAWPETRARLGSVDAFAGPAGRRAAGRRMEARMEAAGEKGVIAVAQLPLSRKLAPEFADSRSCACVRSLPAFESRESAKRAGRCIPPPRASRQFTADFFPEARRERPRQKFAATRASPGARGH